MCKKLIKNSQPFGKKCQKTAGGYFLAHTVDIHADALYTEHSPWHADNIDIYNAVGRSVSQSVGRSVSRSVSQSVSRSVGQSVGQSVSQSVSQSVGQSVGQRLVSYPHTYKHACYHAQQRARPTVSENATIAKHTDIVKRSLLSPHGKLSGILTHNCNAMGGGGGGYISSAGICQLDKQRDSTLNSCQLTQKAPNSL